jgi:hypothetical protein
MVGEKPLPAYSTYVATCRTRDSLSAKDKAAVHRLVTSAVQKAVLSDGKSLSEVIYFLGL